MPFFTSVSPRTCWFQFLIFNRSSFSLATKFVPLPDQIMEGMPRRAQNLSIPIIQLLVSMLGTTSKWTTLLVRQAKRKPQPFLVERLTKTKKGPKKSTPVFENGGSLNASLSRGWSAIFGFSVLALFLWQTTHLETIVLRAVLSLTTASRCCTNDLR